MQAVKHFRFVSRSDPLGPFGARLFAYTRWCTTSK